MVKMIPKTVTAETAATPRAKFLSSLILDSKSVTFTLLLEKLDSCLLTLKLYWVLIEIIKSQWNKIEIFMKGKIGLKKKTWPKMK